MAQPASASGSHDLADFALRDGAALPGAFLTWKTHGTLAPGRSSVTAARAFFLRLRPRFILSWNGLSSA